MPIGIDHVVILADDLDRAVEQYRGLGFTVTPGGRHARFTHNALIVFQDGAYIELIAFYEQPQPGSAETHRWHRHLATGGGLVDFALGAPNLDTVIAQTGTRGARFSGPHPGQRTRPDNIQLRWQMGQAEGENIGSLPFLIEDITDRELRVPSDATEHRNTVRGVRSVVVAVRDLEAAVPRFQALLDLAQPSSEGLPNLENAEGVSFLVGAHRIDVATPTGPGALADYLDRHGEGPFELSLLARESVDLDPAQAAGARIRLVAG
jgi:catechol 2,3-dioxygenase-like lactoylglutathione lyase family enzyme